MKNHSTNQKIILSKILIAMLTIFLGCKCVSAQAKEIQANTEFLNLPDLQNNLHESEIRDVRELSQTTFELLSEVEDIELSPQKDAEIVVEKETKDFRQIAFKPAFKKWSEEEENEFEDDSDKEETSFKPFASKKPEFAKYKESEEKEKFHWKPAMVQSFYFLGIQHAFRMLQTKTTSELDGPFFKDWGRSARNLGGWRDGDSFITNYIAHPMQGAVTGRIFINNSEKSRKQEFGMSKEYWESRFKAMVWSAVWSTQFELGPFSEASIGNVGLYDNIGPNRMAWVDLVVTPTAGTGVMIGEDMIDKYLLKNWLERKIKSRTRIKVYRTFFTPIQSFTNVLSGKVPWKRYNRQ